MDKPENVQPPVDRLVIGLPRQNAYHKMQIMALAMASVGMMNLYGASSARVELPEKPCCQCGKMKRHNNSFCSAECCRVWKSRSR